MGCRLALVRLVVATLVGVGGAGNPDPASAQDLFDVANGGAVTFHSPLLPGEVGEELIGLIPDTGPEKGTLIFGDAGEAGTVHFVEFQTPEPVALGLLRLYAVADSCSTDGRTFDQFRFLADDGGGMQELVNVSIDVPYNYMVTCNNALVLSAGVDVVADKFRAEFTQARTRTFDGLRVLELDGHEAPACADFNRDGEVSAADALSNLNAAVGARYCELCVCDVTADGTITAGDSLNVLKSAVGLPVPLDCPVCGIEGGTPVPSAASFEVSGRSDPGSSPSPRPRRNR